VDEVDGLRSDQVIDLHFESDAWVMLCPAVRVRTDTLYLRRRRFASQAGQNLRKDIRDSDYDNIVEAPEPDVMWPC
jgi:hypothetical protein